MAQENFYASNVDYLAGSPHLRHRGLRNLVEAQIRATIDQLLRRQNRCMVLEVGAGHGFFTETVLEAGGAATLTEMSKPSSDYLTEKFRDTVAVRVIYDADGDAALREGIQHDVILMISVVHHIPDYLTTVSKMCESLLRPGGSLIMFQDPLWYPRLKPWVRALSWTSYFAWRIGQGDFRRGLGTRWRRLRGIYSETEQSDLVEYHLSLIHI